MKRTIVVISSILGKNYPEKYRYGVDRKRFRYTALKPAPKGGRKCDAAHKEKSGTRGLLATLKKMGIIRPAGEGLLKALALEADKREISKRPIHRIGAWRE